MNKIKYIFGILVLALVAISCDDNRFVDPFASINHEELAISDNDSIVAFLKNHYYDTTLDSIKTLVDGKTSLYAEKGGKLKVMNVTENDIDYQLYVYVAREGTPNPVKGFPTVVDSVFVKYEGRLMTTSKSVSNIFDTNTTGFWFTLNAVIRGWTYGLTNFKGGELKKDAVGGVYNGPITYLNGGKGVLFIPSGLAYPSSNRANLERAPALVNDVLIFYIEMLDIAEDTDGDKDGIPSILEDLNGDGDPRNDDTDKDGTPNFLDTDDDNDGKLTKNEDKNKDGNPANDFNDPLNTNLADYLNPKIK